MTPRLIHRLAAPAAVLACALFSPVAAQAAKGDKPVVIELPAAKAVRSEIFLISDADGWNDANQAFAERLRDAGSIVVGIDLPTYVKAINRTKDECVYMVAGIEDLSQTIQRKLGNPDLQLPVVAGFGAGGTLALDIAAQTPDATIARTVAIDPGDRLKLTQTLCTPAAEEMTPSGTIYALTPGTLPDPVSVVFTPQASDLGRAHVTKLQRTWPTIAIEDTDAEPFDAAFRALKPEIETADADPLAGLPLEILDASANRDVMAVVYSGDGGWRDLDKVVAQDLQAAGIPTVGVDSLQYFWSRKTPEASAADLQKIIDSYAREWHVGGVYLIGYSFGADILPSTYLAMDEAHRKLVKKIALLGLSNGADYQISVTGWLGVSSGGRSTLADLAKIPADLVQCFYGREETDTACPALKTRGAEVVATEGGHHFDGNYQALAEAIMK